MDSGPGRTMGVEDIFNAQFVRICLFGTMDVRRGCCVMIKVCEDYLRIAALPSGVSAGAAR